MVSLYERLPRSKAEVSAPRGGLLVIFAGWTVGLSLLFAVTGNTGEGGAALVGAFGYWLAHIGLGLAVLTGVTRLALGAPAFARLPVRVQLVVAGLAGAVAFTPVALVLEAVMAAVGGPWPTAAVDAPSIELAAAGAGVDAIATLMAEEFASLVVPFVGTWLLINLSCLAADPGRRNPVGQSGRNGAPEPEAPEPAAAPGAAVRDGLLGLLKPALGTDVLALKAELNYLHVFTSCGQSMVVYSLSRAAAELGDRGIQVHRSWWVARHAVDYVRRTGKGVRCVLANGLEVPVSRRRQKALLDEFGADFRRAPGPERASGPDGASA